MFLVDTETSFTKAAGPKLGCELTEDILIYKSNHSLIHFRHIVVHTKQKNKNDPKFMLVER